ncbi:MAG TPA: VWA domain-containing protein, partial [Thermoanaerobaculia bacterium]|nr:VWA domain-containing protein [Thermoanaerobaculia bacterium]
MRLATGSRLWVIPVILLTAGAVEGQRAWVQHGPGPTVGGQVEGTTTRAEVAGAINSVAAHPTNADILYVGAVNGGIWRTLNATATTPHWERQLGLAESGSIGAIEFDPTDAMSQTLIAGSGRTSNYYGAGGARVGIFRTTDGATWTRLDGGGTIAGLNVTGVAARGAVLLLSADASDGPAGTGIWRSDNSGANWTRVSGAATSNLPIGASTDLAADPSDNARFFTSAGSSGIYRSDDTGATWTKKSNVAIDNLLLASTRVEIAVGQNNNVYVAIVGPTSRLAGLFRSPDGGDSWDAALDLPVTNEIGGPHGIHPGGQGWNLSLAADPSDDNVVYIGGDRQPAVNDGTQNPSFPNAIGAMNYTGRIFRIDASQAAGSQFAHITHTNTSGGSSPHADSRDMVFDASGNLIETSDGGIYKRTTPKANTGDWFSLIGDIRVTELHDAAWDARSKIMIGGAQDNGAEEEVTSGAPAWRAVHQADGGDVAVDDTSTPGMSIRYSSSQNLGNFVRQTFNSSNVAAASVSPQLTLVGDMNPVSFDFTTLITVNRVDPTRIVLTGNQDLFESLDQGDTITRISGVIVNSFGRDPVAYGAGTNAEALYVGVGDDVLIRLAAGGALTASAAYPGAGSARSVAGIVLDPADDRRAFVCDTQGVFMTPDAGASWTDLTGDLATQTPGEIFSIAYSTSNADGAVVIGAENGVFAARGPQYTTWEPVGDGLPRAPVYDLEYDAVDEILAAGLMGHGAWSVNMEERDPVDVALVLDLSGSMLVPACSTCDSRLQVLKDAVEIFVQLFSVFAIPDDRMALNYFRTDITELALAGTELFPLVANAEALIADVQGQTTDEDQTTAMGGGLQTGIGRLADAARPRNVILFTDGMQNVSPFVNTTTLAIEDVAGAEASNVGASVPPTVLDAALGRKVNTIGVGATQPFVDLLDDIAAATNGISHMTTAPDADLRRFYVEELIDALRSFSPQLIAYRYGSVSGDGAAEEFTTNATTRRLALKVSWKRGAEMSFTVEKDGVRVERLGHYMVGPFYAIFIIDLPTATKDGQPVTPGGTWRIGITGTGGASYEAAAIVDEAQLDYNVALLGAAAGEPLQLGAKVSFSGLPVTDATVTARVRTPKVGLGTLLANAPTPFNLHSFAYEPGATDAQRKYQLLLGNASFQSQLKPIEQTIALQHTGGGNYAATFTGTTFTGPYTAIFDISGSRPDTGTFHRSETRSVSMKFGQAVLPLSGLFVIPEGGTHYELHVKPMDAAGNLLGPDFGDRIVVLVDGVAVPGPLRDLLDGSYAIDLVQPEPVEAANITVIVLEQPLFEGPLMNIPEGTAVGPFAVSLHAGATFPLSGFPSHADNGFLVELDLEYHATPAFSLEGVLGHYDFGSADAINGLTLYAKKYGPVAPWRWYGALGIGGFKSAGGTDLG